MIDTRQRATGESEESARQIGRVGWLPPLIRNDAQWRTPFREHEHRADEIPPFFGINHGCPHDEEMGA